MITAEQIQQTLEGAFPGASISVEDTTGTYDHYAAVIVADQFEGLSRVKRHRAVYAALGNAMDRDIHALQLKTYTPAQYEKLQRRADG